MRVWGITETIDKTAVRWRGVGGFFVFWRTRGISPSGPKGLD